ncbi:hypothetical protein ACU4IU_00380 [Brevibacterium sp. CSND-B09]|uniref:hypothetical protein n=1 Tax=Brevibacterium sp. CSND-B09 TaxID=3462571 RepID=UPI00406A5FD2
MAEKYIDLADRIAIDTGYDTKHSRLVGKLALGWLDENPDQAPGRTITERVKITDTEACELYESARSFSLDDFKLALESIDGIETVDDPAPTNAEKLAEALRGSFNDFKFDLEASFEDMARALDEAGVKAPGGTDDH